MKKVKLFEQYINEESGRDTLGELAEMTMGQLERIEDYAEMISDMMEEGKELESWMFSQITIALENLNAVHDGLKVTEEIEESVVTEARVANKWNIESQHIGKLQKTAKFDSESSMPFSLISRPQGGVSDTDKNIVKNFIDADHVVLQFFPEEDSRNDSMHGVATKKDIQTIEKLMKDEYDLELIDPMLLKGRNHCAGDTCSVSHYLVFGYRD